MEQWYEALKTIAIARVALKLRVILNITKCKGDSTIPRFRITMKQDANCPRGEPQGLLEVLLQPG